MKKSQIKKLIERIDERETVLKQDAVENSYANGRESLVELLSDHPHFEKEVYTLRNKYSLPENGFTDEGEALQWDLDNNQTRTDLIKDIDLFLTDCTFNLIYRSDLQIYFYESVVCPSRCHKWSKANVPSLVILNTDEDKQINAHLVSSNARYIQVFDWTTLKDVERSWDKIKNGLKKQELRNTGNELRRNIWKLKAKGLNYKEIHREFRNSLKHLVENHSDGILDESRIGIYAKRYEESLKRLRDY